MALARRRKIGRSEDGYALIDGLLALVLIALVVAVAIQALAYTHARSVALTAAQDGARAAATDGARSGVARADAILGASGGTGRGLHPAIDASGDRVTVTVSGQAPKMFALGLMVPNIRASSTLPIERYPTAEDRP